MFKLLPKSKYSIEMLSFLTEHTLLIYVQFEIGSKRKTSFYEEKLFKNDEEHFAPDSILIFKRLKFGCSSSEVTVKSYFLVECVLLEIRLINVNQLLQNIMRNK